MSNNTYETRTTLELAALNAWQVDSVEDLEKAMAQYQLTELTKKVYIIGTIAGLNQRLGRLQRTYDIDLENGDDVHAEGVVATMIELDKFITSLTFEHLV